MTRFRHRRHARRGFTLVELMVATALVVLILTILAVAFGAATDSLSRLRSMGNMATDLRGAQDKLRADLEAEHFDSGDSPGVLRLADLKYDQLTPGGRQTTPPVSGYVRIEQSASIYEGEDADRMSSTRANDAIEFTVKRLGTSPDDLFVVPATTPELLARSASDTPIAANQFVTKWARVRWFLGNAQNVGGVQTFTLYRSVRAISPVSGLPIAPATLTAAELPLVSHTSANRTHSLGDLTSPLVRLDADAAAVPTRFTIPYQPGTANQGDDIMLSNVTSFEVKPTWTGGSRGPRQFLPAAIAIGTPIPDGAGLGTTQNLDYPFDDLPLVTENTTLANQRVFDTWSPVVQNPAPPPPATPNAWNVPGSNLSLPLRIRVTALQVKIRVFDPKTLLTRQVSFIVQP